MKWESIILYMFLGWLIGWTVKYIVFGLRNWDTLLHPERLQGDTTGPYSAFASPFLGIFS